MEKAIKFLTEKPGLRKESKTYLANRIGCTEEEVKKALAYLYKHRNSTPYEEFLEEHGVDANEVKAVWLKSKNNRNGIDFSILKSSNVDIKELIKSTFEDLKPFPDSGIKHIQGSGAAVINILDAHLDKISYKSETGVENTVQKNAVSFMDAFYRLTTIVKEAKPEVILFPVGSDFWQVNDTNLTTKRGTPQHDSVHTDTKEMFRLGIRILRTCIDSLIRIAPVHIIPVKGNHDEDRVFYLSEMLKMAYEKEQNVTIEENTTQRIYYRYHKWLFGFAHGDKEKKMISSLPSIMSVERREDWSEIKQGIFFLGDIHHEKKVEAYKSQDFRGVHTKFLRAVSTTDKWHYEHGWIGVPKTAYVFLYDKEANEELEFKVNI